jgi:hypothetical protein
MSKSNFGISTYKLNKTVVKTLDVLNNGDQLSLTLVNNS